MKIRILENPDLEEDIIIEYRELTPEIESMIQKLQSQEILVEERGNEHAIDLNRILFFETEVDNVYAHTQQKSYRTKYRLYELEALLPNNFMRISKSTIVNTQHIASIERNLTSSRCIQFFDTHKVSYVSRMYFSLLKKKLDERSL
ncbi:LytTR family transcriptional regulator [Erysipelothrix sp. HDW6C]|uniref:LytTR family DNA-binding domain-containing protein n=1 Tax=Erysipelothrix sp. HDW6C TaxID=2714930 RepID=UPI00140C0288|nr:LytTR family DNA-binding domain-containing protein [Erysipelothrix sp. HDW6C]QIK70558.1 LytTR family transcriptional regulator [Erysipelothrix sp. HDW6C]